MTSYSSDVIVLGAGLTGVSAALQLANAGLTVAIADQDPRPLNRTSLRNEGKIHLGFVYANDPTLATARLMVKGALAFRHSLSRLANDLTVRLTVSTPFTYVVAPDSLLSAEALEAHYRKVESLYRDHLKENPHLDYLGLRPLALFEPVSRTMFMRCFNAEAVAAAFTTAELSIDPAELCGRLRRVLTAHSRIKLLLSHRVHGVERLAGRYRVEGQNGSGCWRAEAGQVINALWAGRLAVDRTLGLLHPAGWLHRMKYRVIATLPPRLRQAPSATMVLGRYGDVVVWPDGRACLSWYPLGLRGWSQEVAPPDTWNPPCRGDVTTGEAATIARGILEAIDVWYPGIAESEPVSVDAGVIVAYGASDVDDPESGLHQRSQVGCTSIDGYHSVDPGKLTTAPLFGELVGQRVLQLR